MNWVSVTIFFSIFWLIYWGINPLYRTDIEITEKLKIDFPLGMHWSDVEAKLIEKYGEENISIRNTGFFKRKTGKEKELIGVKSILVELGWYWWIGTTNVSAFFGFNERDLLISGLTQNNNSWDRL